MNDKHNKKRSRIVKKSIVQTHYSTWKTFSTTLRNGEEVYWY